MGLDSVEILWELEKYFGIAIANQDAEKIVTVWDSVSVVASYLGITAHSVLLRERVFAEIIQSTESSSEWKNRPQLTDNINTYLPTGSYQELLKLSKATGLSIQKPSTRSMNQKGARWLSVFAYQPTYNWADLTIGAFVDAVCFCNYKTLINPINIQSLHEIYIVVGGIVIEKLGVDAYDILPEKSFIDDFGID